MGEVDSGIHELLFKKIMQAVSNVITGQIIMTTHNTTLMETEFAREATYIIKEDENGRIKACAISGYEKRTYVSNNIRSKYMNGDYEGIPKVTDIEFAPLIKAISNAIN